MTFKEVRIEFVEKTGRTDLVKGNGYTDNGADFYINSGLRLLDMLQDNPYTERKYIKDIAAGDHTLHFQYCRAIDKVWVMSSTSRYELTKKNRKWMRDNYGLIIADLAQGTPIYYAPNIIKLAPSQIDLTAITLAAQATYDTGDVEFGRDWTYNGIVFMPPSNAVYTMTVDGKWHTERLSGDDDTNYWTEEYPDLLIEAAIAELELFHRNREGFLDIVEGLKFGLRGVDNILVEQEIAGNSQMENS